ncbi:MAG: hypothetical protein MJZ37_00700 [Bacilli bacterium]|nr:hypothetical protein [Bacilli bacterium]
MISRTNTRTALRKALLHETEMGKKKIYYPMAEFRHAIFETVDLCKRIVCCNFQFDREEKLTICNLIFKTCTVKCSYSYSTGNVLVELFNEIKQDDEYISVLSQIRECKCKQLPQIVLSMQPITKVVIKRKK